MAQGRAVAPGTPRSPLKGAPVGGRGAYARRMNEALATFLRGNSARPNAAWALPLPEVRRPRGRIDWYDTLRLFSGSVVALGAPEMMEGLGRLLLFALDAVGGPQETIERAALLLMTGERDVLQFIHGGPWTGDHRQ